VLTYSTVARIDSGFSGHITLGFSNAAMLPNKLRPGMNPIEA
jgi:deoxycytidine triphosphate deaminase